MAGNPSPIVVTVYQLKSPFAFEQSSFDALENNSAKALGNDLLDRQTIEVRPNSQQYLDISLSGQTQYLGIVAAYRNINQAIWHKAIKIRPKQAKPIQINLESQALSVNGIS